MAPSLPKGSGFKFWPEDEAEVAPGQFAAAPRSTADVIKLYNQGFAGAFQDFEARDLLQDAIEQKGFGSFDGEKVAYVNGLAGSGAGKLSLPYLYAWEHWPKCWPCPGQETGDCVSHGGKNAALVLIGVECALAQPDPKTGVVEGWPEISELGVREGVVACEPSYGYRGHRGQGANCSTLVRYFTTVGGTHLRWNYPAMGMADVPNLEEYVVRLGMNWGGSGPPEAVNKEGQKHQIRTAANASNHEICRDFIANGYPIWACSGLGWSSTRDENGFSVQRGGWSHSWDAIAYDDRPDTVSIHGYPWFLYLHDWGKWNGGPRDIRDSASMVPEGKRKLWESIGLVNPQTGNILIPEGTFWGDARLLDRCECTAMSNLNGWPRRNLPDFGATGVW